METTVTNLTARLLVEAGIHRAVVSPGARNAPLLQSLSDADMSLTVVADERVAAFVALGMAVESGEPIAIACTSGSALLNYAPALAEALYRRVPIVVLSADRPAFRIDRADSQTIHQTGALAAVVKRSNSLPAASGSDALKHSRLLIIEAINEAISRPGGPVHINIPIDFEADRPEKVDVRPITVVHSDHTLSTARSRQLGCELASPRKILIVAGGMMPSQKINKAIAKISALPNVAVVAEPTANIHATAVVRSPEATLTGANPETIEALRPEVVITIGGAIISARLKKLLSSTPHLEHWAVGGLICGALPDTFGCLTKVIDLEADAFMPLLASAMQPHRATSDYAAKWLIASHRGEALFRSAINRSPWGAMSAITSLLTSVPRRWNIQVSNGMSIRIASLAASIAGQWHRFDCNRGVSGIDGSTSTAIGASITYTAAPTLFISGDMSALYDLASLASGIVPSRFRMAVISNGGGEIFRFSKATRNLPIRSELLEMEGLKVPLKATAEGCGMDYYEAASMEELKAALPLFASEAATRPALLNIITSGALDSEIFTDYYQNSSRK